MGHRVQDRRHHRLDGRDPARQPAADPSGAAVHPVAGRRRGHCYLREPNLIREAAKILQADRELIGPCLADLVAGEGAVREPMPATGDTRGGTVPAVYLVPFHRAERSLAGGLPGLLNSPRERLPAFTGVDWHKALGWLRSGAGLELAAGQQEAVKLALKARHSMSPRH